MSVLNASQDVIVIGFGEVGRAFGAQIERVGITPTYVDPVAQGTHGPHEVLGALPDRLPAGALLLGAIPSAAASAVARQVAALDGDALYIDLSSSSQDLMRDCAALFEGSQTRFVDGAIMGSVDLAGAAAPIILSGPAADDAADALTKLGFAAQALPASRAGDACGLKLLRTLMTKGIEVLAIECFATAQRMGLDQEIRANLLDISARPFSDLLDAMVRTHVIHAPRRQHEVEAALAQARALGLRAPVTEAVLSGYQANAQRIAAENPGAPETVDQAVRWLSEGLQ